MPEVVDESGEYSVIAYANLVALLAEAIEEQQKQLTRQEKRIESLEARLAKGSNSP